MITIVYDNVWARLDPKPKVGTIIYETLKEHLSYRPAGYQHTWKYKHKKWDGYDYVIDFGEMAFRQGLVPFVTDILESNGEKVRHDVTPEYKIPENISKQRTIDGRIVRYPHQIEFLKLIKSKQDADEYEWNTGAGSGLEPSWRGIYASPTGTGKTILMADAASIHKTKSIVLVADTVLLDQTKDALERMYDAPVGMVGDGEFSIEDVTVCTLQSACSILGLRNIKGEGKRGKKAPKLDPRRAKFADFIRSVGTVVHDEVHYAENDSIMMLYEHLVSARYFYGFSATPYKWLKKIKAVKNLLLEQHFGKLEFTTDDKYDFVNMGLTVPLNVVAMPMPVIFEGFRTYNDALAEQVVHNEARNETIVRAMKGMVSNGLSSFIYFRRLEHAEILQNMWGDGSPVIISGKTSRKKRREVFDALAKKEILSILSDIGTVGLDIRPLECIAMASPQRDVRQLKGRVCRASAETGKTHGLIFDPVDHTNILKKHWRARYNQYISDGNAVIGCIP